MLSFSLMDTIQTTTILDRGVKYLGNHPDHLSRRIVLAQLLVDSRAVRSIEAGIILFKLWASPESRVHPMGVLMALANKRAKLQ